MSKKLTVFIVAVLGWAALVGLGLSLADVALDSVTGLVVIAVLYMPSPLVAAVIAEGGLVRARFRLPRGGARHFLVFLLAPAAAVFTVVLLAMAVVGVGGNLLGVAGLGSLATTQEALAAGAADLLGATTVAAAGPPPPFVVLLLAGLWGALLAGWTVNGVFALGEEYGWRGLMWEDLRHSGIVRANLLTGLAWGLWHAPLILQGYNYPGHPYLGVATMTLFCTGMSFVLSALRELTGSVLPAAAAHGIFNALAPLLLILAPGAHPAVGGPVGIVTAVLFIAAGGALWSFVPARTAAEAVQVVPTRP